MKGDEEKGGKNRREPRSNGWAWWWERLAIAWALRATSWRPQYWSSKLWTEHPQTTKQGTAATEYADRVLLVSSSHLRVFAHSSHLRVFARSFHLHVFARSFHLRVFARACHLRVFGGLLSGVTRDTLWAVHARCWATRSASNLEMALLLSDLLHLVIPYRWHNNTCMCYCVMHVFREENIECPTHGRARNARGRILIRAGRNCGWSSRVETVSEYRQCANKEQNNSWPDRNVLWAPINGKCPTENHREMSSSGNRIPASKMDF